MMRFLATVVVWCWLGALASVSAQDRTEREIVYDQGHQAYQNKEYEKAAELYLESLTCPEASAFEATTLYNISCCYSLAGKAEEAFLYLQKAVRAGFDDIGWLKEDSDFDFLRSEHAQRFDQFLRGAGELVKGVRQRKSPVAVLEYSNYTGYCDLGRYRWDDFDNSLLDSLRNTYQLLAIIEPGATEFEKMLLMLDWVSSRWQHSGANACKDLNALAILEAAEKGGQFRCVEYAVVLANCLTAVGYPARVVGLQMDGVAYGSGKGHVCTEAW
ncbi:MAG: transglutaminase domain-containing protein, partial [Candidatus Zixiibacteriota bacterium]